MTWQERLALWYRDASARAGGSLLIRAAEITPGKVNREARTCELSFSSEFPVERWGDEEVLLHGKGNADLSRLTSVACVLINHDPNQRGAAIRTAEIVDKRGVALIYFPKTDMGEQTLEEVDSGTLRGVSFAYNILRHHTEELGGGRQKVIADEWAAFEITLTPIPADPTVGVGRADEQALAWRSFTRSTQPQPKDPPMTLDQLLALFPDHAAQVRSLHAAGKTPEQIAQAVTGAIATAARSAPASTLAPAAGAQGSGAAPNANAAADTATAVASALAAQTQRTAQIVANARTLGVHDQVEQWLTYDTVEKARDAMLVEFSKRSAGAAGNPAVVTPRVQVLVDGQQKRMDAAVDGLLFSGGAHRVKGENPGYRGHRPLAIFGDMLEACGLQGARSMLGIDLAAIILGKAPMQLRAAATEMAHFATYVLGNYMDKAIMAGFDNYKGTWNLWAKQRQVVDFKTFDGAAVDIGSLQEKAEGIPYPELARDEAGYTAALGLFGGMISLTLQALSSDDLGVFDDKLTREGAKAARTIDRETYRQLLNYDWSTNGALTTTVPIATAGKLDTVRKDFTDKKGPAGEILGNAPRYLLYPSGIREAVMQATVPAVAPSVYQANTDLIPIQAPLLNDSTLNGTDPLTGASNVPNLAGASATDYYLAGDPAMVDTVVVAFLTGWGQMVKVFEKDSGAVAARNFLMLMPMRAKVAGKYGVQRGNAA